MTKIYDYIVVGAGTAGCLLANRLSSRKDKKVLLVEAGPRPRSLWVNMPAGVSKLIFPGPLNWGFQTEEEPYLHNRRVYAPRGRGLGGSSLINGMGFFRGQAQDFDDWHALGVTGWSWDELLPLYMKLETRPGTRSPRRGVSGELYISDARFVHPATHDFIAAARASGIPYNGDFNDASAEGVGPIQFNIKGGARHSSDKAFLYTVEKSRANLEILTGAQVARVLVEDAAATGIEVVEQGERRTIRCSGEVILCAGAFGSPHLLMHSGLGPGSELQSLGIPVRADLPGVGRNLQDHLYIHHTFGCDPRSSMNASFTGVRALLHGARYLLTRGGPLTTGASQACAFVKSSPQVSRADLQIAFRPVSWSFGSDGTLTIGKDPELTVSVCNLRPGSRGCVRLASADPLAAPRIQANYLGTEGDRDIAVKAVRTVRRIFGHAPLASHITAEKAPGPGVGTDTDILDYVQRTAQSMHHWAGSCRMGADADTDAVVDSQLRVRGVRRLRVADASVLPRIVSANTNAVTYLVAEKAATFFP
jgi:choline dehydrogenase